MRPVLLLSLIATACLADDVIKNAGVRLGPITNLDCSADAGVNCTRTGSTGTGNLRCTSATATELGCVSTTTQSFGGAKTFTGAVQAPSYGGADAGVFVKLSDGSSLIGAGAWNTYQPYGMITAAAGVVPGTMGNVNGTGASKGIASKINVTGLYGSAFIDGLDTDGGAVSNDGGAKGYWLTLTATDDAGSRTICSSFQICANGVGALHPRSDTSCGADGGGIVNRNGYLLLQAATYTAAGVIALPECQVPAVNYVVNYTGMP